MHQRTDHARAHPAGYASPGLSGTRAAVRCALDAGLESVAIPGMGTGTGGLAPREAAAAMLWGIRDALYPPAFPASLADVLSF